MVNSQTIDMAKKKELSEDLRSRIVNAHKDGKGYKAIGKQFQVPVATVQSIITKFKKFHTVENLKGRGRKPKMTSRLSRKVVRQVSNNPRITTKAILKNLSDSGTTISRQTLQRTLHNEGLRGCRPRKTPLLQPRHVKARLAFAKAHIDKDASFWLSMLWSDETKWSFLATGMWPSFGEGKVKRSNRRTQSRQSSMVVEALCFGDVSLPVGLAI